MNFGSAPQIQIDGAVDDREEPDGHDHDRDHRPVLHGPDHELLRGHAEDEGDAERRKKAGQYDSPQSISW